MNTQRIVGIVLLVLGVALLIVGYNASQSVGEQLSETVTGRFSEATTWYIIAGIVAGLVGLLLLVIGGGSRSSP